MKFKNKQKSVENPPPPAKMVTENQLQDHLKNLQTQRVDALPKAVMLQGAIQMVELQIQEMNNPPEKTLENKNGVN